MHKDYHGLRVANTDPFDEWWGDERGTEIEEYDVYDDLDEGEKPEYE